MALSNSEITNRAKSPIHLRQIRKAIEHEDWLRFHSEEAIDRKYAGRYVIKWEDWVRQLLPSDKFQFFLKMMRFPVYSNSLVNSMQDEFNKVFDSQNPSFSAEFINDELEADFQQFLQEERFFQKWVNDSKDAMLKHISSLCIVDMPSEPTTPDTRPYFYFQPVSTLRDIDYQIIDGNITKINSVWIYKAEDEMLFIDDLRYAILKKIPNGQENAEWKIISETFHELGFCPVCFFWQEAIQKDEPVIKKSMITQALNNLDYLVLSENWRRCLEAYAAFPILEKIAEDCTYYEEIDGNKYQCEDGYLNIPNYQKRCPVCEKNQFVGAGSVIEHSPPSSKDIPETIGKSRFLEISRDSLDYWTERSKEQWDEVYYDCVGMGGDTLNQAINKDQVKGTFESKHNKCMKIVQNIEVSVNFVLFTIAKLRYENRFISVHYSMGNRFYLQSAESAQQEFKTAKESSVPAYLLAYKRNQVDAANTKGNPVETEMIRILKNLEPFVDLSLDECKALELNLSKPDEYMVKANFSSYILRFERENGSIIEFGSKIPFSNKIEKIKKVLLSYNESLVSQS